MLPTAFAVTLVVWVLRWMGVIGPRAPKDGKSAREILDERFARGEIDQAEYEERKLAISS
jgi:putative membrane protein